MSAELRCAPVALFVYNRPEHTRKTVEALRAGALARHTPLYVFSDAPRDEGAAPAVRLVREYIETIEGFASLTIIRREKNLGLADSIIDGVGTLCERFGRVIVLEDDLLTSSHFLSFMNEALDVWADDDRVSSVCGYMYPVELDKAAPCFFLSMPQSWGWGTWADRWKSFQRDGEKLLAELESRGLRKAFDRNGPYSYVRMLKDQVRGRNQSWYVRWHASSFLSGRLSLYPRASMVRNIGIDGSGVHCADWRIDPFSVALAEEPIRVARGPVAEHVGNQSVLNRYFTKIRVARYINFFYRKLTYFRRRSTP